jgi:hypothetical protein
VRSGQLSAIGINGPAIVAMLAGRWVQVVGMKLIEASGTPRDPLLELTAAPTAESPVEVGVEGVLGPPRSLVSGRIAVDDGAVVAAQDTSVIAAGPAVAVWAEHRVPHLLFGGEGGHLVSVGVQVADRAGNPSKPIARGSSGADSSLLPTSKHSRRWCGMSSESLDLYTRWTTGHGRPETPTSIRRPQGCPVRSAADRAARGSSAVGRAVRPGRGCHRSGQYLRRARRRAGADREDPPQSGPPPAPRRWSYDRIAAVTGLSKGRVAQLSKDPRRGA